MTLICRFASKSIIIHLRDLHVILAKEQYQFNQKIFYPNELASTENRRNI